ncbi:UNVERIFIED_CONTAM: hypothetical protein FKN15_004711 [Acipenser sinensis]
MWQPRIGGAVALVNQGVTIDGTKGDVVRPPANKQVAGLSNPSFSKDHQKPLPSQGQYSSMRPPPSLPSAAKPAAQVNVKPTAPPIPSSKPAVSLANVRAKSFDNV